jgi:hypothetical protein
VVKVTGLWPEFTRRLKDEQVFILFFRGSRLQIVPKRAFPGAAAAQAYGAPLSRKVGPPGMARKWLWIPRPPVRLFSKSLPGAGIIASGSDIMSNL